MRQRARQASKGVRHGLILWLIHSLILGTLVATAARAAADPAGRDGETAAVRLARKHYKSGEEAFKAGDFERARHEFEAGYALVPRPGFLLNMAHSERRLGHLRSARSLYEKYLLADPEAKQRDEVMGFIKMLDRAIADEDKAKAETAAPPAAEPAPRARPAPPPPSPPEPAVVVTPPPAADTPAPVPAAREPAAEAAPAVTLDARAPAAADEEAQPSRPVYARWWFWAAVAVVAAGAATGAFLATRGGPAFHDDGSLGRLGSP